MVLISAENIVRIGFKSWLYQQKIRSH